MAVCSFRLNQEELNIDPYEVLRYLGYVREKITTEDIRMVEDALEKIRDCIEPVACYERYEVTRLSENELELPYGNVVSKNLTLNLKGCQECYIFAATIGAKFDRIIMRTRVQSMAQATIYNAIGAAAVENLCDKLNEEIRLQVAKEGKYLKPRYSPGYGDLSLDNQKGIFRILIPEKNAGITLKDNLIMAPEKSVTAFIGIVDEMVE